MCDAIMKNIEILFHISSDFLSMIDIVFVANLIYTQKTKLFNFKTIICYIVFIILSVIHYNLFFYIYNPLFNISLLAITYLRFPITITILKKINFVKAIYISLITSQSCDLIQTLICNIVKTPNKIYDYCISLIVRLSVLLFLILMLKKVNLNRLKGIIRLLPKHIYVLIAINILLMGALTSVTRYETANLNAQIVSINVVLLLIFVFSIAILFSLISNCISKTYYNSVNSILEKQIENQIEHYNQAEILNSDLRRFKHDYTNHILCLKAMIKSNHSHEALEYIERINTEISLSTKTFNTGHKIADAILNEKHRKHSDISINFDGNIPYFIDNVDLCIVLGNAVDNAVEACEKLNDTDKIIDVTANFQQSHFVLIIKNPVSKDYTINGSFPETTKQDHLKHGFGLSNIKRIVDKYEGDMSVEADNGIFTLYLAIKTNHKE